MWRARSIPGFDMWTVAEPVVREWIERHLGAVGTIEDASDGVREVGRFFGEVPGLLNRGAALIEQLDTITRDGLVLAPETVAAIGRAEARRNRWIAAALWSIAGSWRCWVDVVTDRLILRSGCARLEGWAAHGSSDAALLTGH